MNKKKKKNLIISLVILTILIGFNGIMIVRGDDPKVDCNTPDGKCVTIGGNGGTADNGTTQLCTDWCYYIFGTGVRISLVDQSGARVAGTKSYDIFGTPNKETVPTNYGDPSYLNSNIHKYPDNDNGTGHIRQEIPGQQNFVPTGKTFDTIATVTSSDIGSAWYLSNEVGINNLFGQGKTSSAITGKATAKVYYDRVLAYLTAKAESDPDKMLADTQELLNQLGYTTDLTSLSQDELKKLYIQFEPMILIRYKHHGDRYRLYYGTISELAFNNGAFHVNSTTWGHNAALARKYATKDYGIGLRIIPGKDKPDPFKGVDEVVLNKNSSSGDNNWNIITQDKWDGYAVAHIWLGIVEPQAHDCEFILDVIHKNSDKYPVPSPQYDAAVAAIKSGDTDFSFEAADGSKYHIDKGYSDTMLDPANYKDGKAECNDAPPKVCTGAPVEKSIDTECTSGYNFYKDSSDEEKWLKCEIAYTDGGDHSSENTGHPAIPDDANPNDGVVGNKEYCEVFCYEEVTTDFPLSGKAKDGTDIIRAGQTFLWGKTELGGEDVFGAVKIHKHCSNQDRVGEGLSGDGYLYKKWENDYKANEKKLIEGYIKAGAADEARDHINASTTSCIYTYVPCTKYSNGHPYPSSCPVMGIKGVASANQTLTNNDGGEDPGNWTNASSQPVSENAQTACYPAGTSSSFVADMAKNMVDTKLSNIYSTSMNQHDEATKKEEELLIKLNQCTANLQYEYKTTIDFVFQEPKNGYYGENNRHTEGYTYDNPLTAELTEDNGYSADNVDLSECDEETVYTYKCDGTKKDAKCDSKEKMVKNCEKVTWDIAATWVYKYPSDDFTWFSLKTNSNMVNAKHKDTSIEEAYYYSIGFGLPTAFTLPSGIYGGDSADHPMKVIVSYLGDAAPVPLPGAEYNSPDGHFAPVADKDKGFEYFCTYEVDNDIFGYDCQYDGTSLSPNAPAHCDESKDNTPDGGLIGIDVNYRVIDLLKDGDSLYKAFPGQSGFGRDTGSNWNKVYSEIPEILRADIYEKDREGRPNLAMYEIYLDVATIQYIREENDKFNGDAYTSVDNIVCDGDGNDKYCASKFLTDLHDKSLLVGTCLPDLSTEQRAADVHTKGCYNGSYTPLTITWKR